MVTLNSESPQVFLLYHLSLLTSFQASVLRRAAKPTRAFPIPGETTLKSLPPALSGVNSAPMNPTQKQFCLTGVSLDLKKGNSYQLTATMKLTQLFIAAAISAAPSMSAAIAITSGGSGAGGDAYVTFSQDVTFTVTGSASKVYFVIDEAVVPSDGTRDILSATGLQYDINGGAPKSLSGWADNFWLPQGAATSSDSYFYGFDSAAVTTGDTVTLHAGTFTVTAANTDFSVLPTGSYSMFLINSAGSASIGVGVSAVPEPGGCALVMAVVCGVVAWGRRRFSV